jgi:SOS-response transcriptional repressor LexA
LVDYVAAPIDFQINFSMGRRISAGEDNRLHIFGSILIPNAEINHDLVEFLKLFCCISVVSSPIESRDAIMISSPSDTNDHFAERLRFWRVRQNLTQAEASRRLDIDRSYLSQIERGRRPGKALRTRFLLIEKSSSVTIRGGDGLRNLPVLSWTQAAQTTDLGEIPQEWDDLVPSDVTDERAFGVRLHGDSMEPKFSDGDIAILLPGAVPTNGDVVIANLKDEGLLCKIMHLQLDKNLVKLSSYNPAHPPVERHRDQFHWLFPVAVILKQLRLG